MFRQQDSTAPPYEPAPTGEPAPASEPPPPTRRVPRPGARARTLGLFASGVLATFLALVLYGNLFPAAPPLTQRDVARSVASALASQTPPPAFSQTAYAAIAPSLVAIETRVAATGPAASGAGGDPTAAPNGDLGTGVVVNAAGDILTSLHVVADATTISLTFADGTKSTATITVRQADKDIAVLRADTPPARLVPATLGNPAAAQVGSEVFVVGNPFGLYDSISAGVVSGLHRSFQLPHGGPVLTELIQVDAAVNPGNSGGPLLNRNGQVIGIVAALVNPTRESVFIGIGLAVPIDVAGGAAGLPLY